MATTGDGQQGGGMLRRSWRSVVRGPIVPATDRGRRRVVFNALVLRFRPTRLPAALAVAERMPAAHPDKAINRDPALGLERMPGGR